MAQDLGARRTEVSIIGNSRGDPSSPRLFAAKVGGEGVQEWAGAVRAFARMPTLATMKQSRRWVTPDLGHPPLFRLPHPFDFLHSEGNSPAGILERMLVSHPTSAR